VRPRVAVLEGPAFALAAAGSAALVAFVLVELGPLAAIALASLPVIAVGVVYVVTSGQYLTFAAAIMLPMLAYPGFGLPVTGTLYYQDVFAAIALGALIFARFLGRGRIPAIPRTPVLGVPFVLFGAAIISATIRGHYEYGASLFGQPLRLVMYAAIVAGLIGMTVPRMYRLLHVLFYTGAVYVALVAAFFIATGGSTTSQDILSTGGTRPISITTSTYCAGALFLALLNLRFGIGHGPRLLHLGMAALALFGVVAGFGRAVYASVGIVGLLLLLTSPRLRSAILSVLPLALPFIVVLFIGVTQAAPELVSSIEGRLFSAPETDTNVRWRVEANRAVLEQVREAPITGVGFGRGSAFFLEVPDPVTGWPTFPRVEIGQDPHNGYVYLLAGGGVIALGTFLLLIGTFAGDAVKRYRRATDPRARVLLLWAPALLFVFLFNAASGATFAVPENILTIWALLVLPAVVQPGREAEPGVTDAPPGGDGGLAEGRRSVRPAW
jgi:O-antigen ligase